MDGHHRGFLALECYLAGICALALADGDMGYG